VIFSLEALPADQGDCLLLHFGPSSDPLVAVVDGGPTGVYKRTLRPRLDALRASRADGGTLQLQLVAVSHIDDDHIRGVLDLVRGVARERDDGHEPSFEILGLWHNSFEDIVGGEGPGEVPAAVAALGSRSGAVSSAGLSEPARLVAASIAQGRDLRDAANALELDVNHPFEGPVTSPKKVDWGDGLSFVVVGPRRERLDDLHDAWERDVRKHPPTEAKVAAYLDGSVYNLSSIVMLAQAKRKRILFTGDARGDDILDGLRAAGLLKRAPLHVDVLKLPHHGSDRNVETDFFRRIVADHYVVSADGKFGNPEMATLQMISDSREDDDFVVHMTYRDGKQGMGARLEKFRAKEKRAGRRYEVRFPEGKPVPSLVIDLLDPLED
jgi:hypothetical protein